MSKKAPTSKTHVFYKLIRGPYRPVDKQIIRWRKKRRKLAQLQQQQAPADTDLTQVNDPRSLLPKLFE